MYAMAGCGQGGGYARRPAFVVDDDVQMRNLLSEVAASVGLAPLAFTSLTSARDALHDQVPAVLVLDDDLPDGSGADFVRELRADPRTRDAKVIVCTSAEEARRREIAAVAPVIAKPFSVEDVERALREVATG
ncbi:MAG TPA: response regulator [Candidatus Limnocylindria bacterium]|nr:response regulator [Candidatus Limnocylindria bacterium]